MGGSRPCRPDADVRTRGLDQLLGTEEAVKRGERRQLLIRRVALHLGDVEHPRGLGNTAHAIVLLVARLSLVLLVEDDQGGFLALAHLGIQSKPLTVSAQSERGY